MSSLLRQNISFVKRMTLLSNLSALKETPSLFRERNTTHLHEHSTTVRHTLIHSMTLNWRKEGNSIPSALFIPQLPSLVVSVLE